MNYRLAIELTAKTKIEFIHLQDIVDPFVENLRREHIAYVYGNEWLLTKRNLVNLNLEVNDGEIEKYAEVRRSITSKSTEYMQHINVIPEGKTFSVSFCFRDDEEGIIAGEEKVYSFLNDINCGRIRIGINTTLGRGLCSYNCMKVYKVFESGVEEILDNFDEDTGKMIFSELISQESRRKYENTFVNECDYYVIHAGSTSGILVRDKKVKKKHDDDKNTYYGIKNGDNLPMIPASTWKGIFRACISQWCDYIGESENIVDEMFGNRDKEIKGCLVFYDSVIPQADYVTVNRAYIDKFTAAFHQGSLVSDTYVKGDFDIRIECLNDIKKYRKYIDSVLRDLNNHRINVGAGFGIGKGCIDIYSVEVEKGKQISYINEF